MDKQKSVVNPIKIEHELFRAQGRQSWNKPIKIYNRKAVHTIYLSTFLPRIGSNKLYLWENAFSTSYGAIADPDRAGSFVVNKRKRA